MQLWSCGGCIVARVGRSGDVRAPAGSLYAQGGDLTAGTHRAAS